MDVKVMTSNDFTVFKTTLKSLDENEQTQGIMIYLCDNHGYNEFDLECLLKSCKATIFGGVFPSILAKGVKHNEGAIFMCFSSNVSNEIIHNIHSEPIDKQLFEMRKNITKGKTFFVNFDGLSEGVELLKEELFYTLGLSHSYIGGGAGSLSFLRHKCVISNEGLLKDAAVITLVDIYSGIGVAHGWHNVSDPIKVTEVEGNSIISLNWEPAFKVYQEHINNISETEIHINNFFEIAKAYPFGITKMGTEMVVRDPISIIEGDKIVCVGAIPLNSFVYILNGNAKTLIDGASKAKQLATEAYKSSRNKELTDQGVTLFIDCISRALFLEDDYKFELEAIGDKNVYGALTLGEIANTGKAYLELYNKTAVIGILEE